MPAPLDEQKQALRAAVRGRCKPRGPELDAPSSAAQERLLASGLLDTAAVVALYQPLPSELQTALLAERLAARGALVCLPGVLPDQRALVFHAARGPLRKTALGFDEPVPAADALVPLERIDAFVLPGLAADAAGRRLGRGRGHYDATLALAPRALRVLLLCDAGLVPEVPVGEHDALLDAVCTESRLWLCTPRARAAARPGAGTEAP